MKQINQSAESMFQKYHNVIIPYLIFNLMIKSYDPAYLRNNLSSDNFFQCFNSFCTKKVYPIVTHNSPKNIPEDPNKNKTSYTASIPSILVPFIPQVHLTLNEYLLV